MIFQAQVRCWCHLLRKRTSLEGEQCGRFFSYQGSGTFLGLRALGRLVQETGSLFNDMTGAPVHQKESSPHIWTEFWGPC